MTLKTLFLGTGLLLAQMASGQQVTKEQFEKAVDYVTCRFSLHSLESDPKFSAQAEQFRQECHCETATGKQVLALLKQMGVGGTSLLAQELASVKKAEIQRFERKSPQMTIDFLTEGVFKVTYTKNGKPAPKYTTVSAFRAKLKDDDLAEIREELRPIVTVVPSSPAPAGSESGVDQDTAESTAAPEDVNDTQPGNDASPGYKPQPENKGVDWLDASIGLIFGLLSGGSIAYFLMGKKRRDAEFAARRKSDTGSEKMSNEYERVARRDQETISALRKELEALKAENLQLKTQLAALTPQTQTGPTQATGAGPLAGGAAGAEPTTAAGSIPERYFSIPDTDERQRGYWFDDNGVDSYRPYASTYRLTPVGDGQTARFEVVNASEAMSKLVGSRVSGVLPVCTELNAYRPDAKRIMTKQPGKARREGDRWVVTEPAQIEYA